MAIKLEAGSKASYISKRYIRVVEATTLYQNEDIRLIAIAAGALYKLPRTELIHKERLDEYMKHLYKVPGTNKQVVKKFVRIGEGSIIYGIGHHRFIEMARAAGATYKINEGTGGTVLINLEIFDEYIDHFGKEAFVTVSKDEKEYVTRTELENLKRQMIDAAVSAAKDEIIRISLGSKDEAETASYISRTRMDSQKEKEEPQDDDTISDYALSYLMDGMEE